MKIIDKIHDQEQEATLPFFSFEFFPPKTEQGRNNLLGRIERMVSNFGPLFIDVTWGAGGTTSDSTLSICSWVTKFAGTDSMMHLTCTNMSQDLIDTALLKAKEAGIQNILALRGDPPVGEKRWTSVEGGFEHAVDLVRYIKAKYGNFFGIAVAGYPEGHIDNSDKEQDLIFLKEKVDAGADFVITQLFYDTTIFLDFVDRCRAIGITCPIIPGIMPIQTYQGFIRMTSLCKTAVPSHILEAISLVRLDDAKVKDLGIEIAVEMCKTLLQHGVPGLHFYTLNLEKSINEIIKRLRLLGVSKQLPWRTGTTRVDEDVRPINWVYRPKAYIARTDEWDEFPNGRWGDSRSPAFGSLYTLNALRAVSSDRKKLLKCWGTPLTVEDVISVFTRFLKGQINRLPWFEEALEGETNLIQDFLLRLNEHGFLTITSQPQVNAGLSSDPVIGWGPDHGYVYQRAFVEFFCKTELVDSLIAIFEEFPSISYLAADVHGNYKSNLSGGDVIAVTWGVFPKREVVQPTIVDPEAFKVWRDEAFAVWVDEWAVLYPEDSPSRALLTGIRDSYTLVNIVENDYIRGSIDTVFERVFSSGPFTSSE
jgi:methylenetetrahydrofolate reductase (NADPH)